MSIEKMGRQSWRFFQPPVILSGAAVAGPKEGEGPLKQDFDHIYAKTNWGKNSFEQAEHLMQEKAAYIALAKAGLSAEDIDLFLAGDLINQIMPSAFTARSLGIPYLGLFSACATIVEALSLAALAVSAGAARRAMALAGSHNCTAERQFRYPNEYGAQKPPYSQYTATAAGAAIVGSGEGLARITMVTVGRVVDEKVTDPFQMGAAMAPAFADTVAAHFRETKRRPEDYDLVLSGDLGQCGCGIAGELLARQGVDTAATRFDDCGLMLFGQDKSVFCGGSGCGCSAAVGFGHILRRIAAGELRRVLLCATGALLSPVSNQQRESIPAICHAVALEGGKIDA
jgi:stage V sporulation protein AD